ncbi:virulence associated lipoprotein [Borreliella bissettiae]|uniref:Antigen, P35 n=1 Tax=Borrelia bissettiae TaxID=64897 RepID=A0A1L8ZA01_BORBI|nr:virulence associated lipoprotein [Borreliella bissettiae]MCD2401681.1 virulence associated lipoprotein [Borreliella bissettiae]OJH14590.1 antigen, P35 [Borreliella bissettiae]
MKYNIIVSIFVFLFLNACNPNFNTNQKDMRDQSSKKELKSNKEGLKTKTAVNLNQEANPNQEEAPNKRIKNTPIEDLRNLIETANIDREKYVKKLEEEPLDQYGILAFKKLVWVGNLSGEKIADNSEKSKRYRKCIYATLNAIDTNKLKELSEIIILSEQTQSLFNIFNGFGSAIDDVIVYLYSKKNTIDKLDTLDLEKLKNSFEKLLSTKTIVSEMLNQLLLDYQNNKNLIKTNSTKLKSHVIELYKELIKKREESEKIKSDIFSIHTLKVIY